MNKSITIFLLVVLPACTTLDVKLQIFDPTGVTSDDALEATVTRPASDHSYLLKTDYYSRAAIDLKSQVANFLANLASVQCPDESKVIADEDLPKITRTATNNVEVAISEAVKARNEGVTILNQAKTIKKEERVTQLTTALSRFSTANKALLDLSTNFQQAFDENTKQLIVCLNQKPTTPNLDLLGKIITLQRQTQTSIEQKVESLTGGGHLLDDPLAPSVIAAPDQFWKGVYNETSAMGTMGNTDIAIKMEGNSFTIKGLRVDASKVTEATFDVLKQSVRMVAAAYGVPMPAGGRKTQQDAVGSPTDVLMAADEIRHVADRRRMLSKTAALTLLDLIVAQRSDLTSAPTRATAIQNLKRSFDAYKGQLPGN